MRRKPFSSNVLLALLVAGLTLPIMICVALALAALLAASDELGAKVLRYVALAGGAVWIVVLIGLVIVQAIEVLGRSDDSDP